MFGVAPAANNYDFTRPLDKVVLDDVAAYEAAVASEDKAILEEIEAKREAVRARVSSWEELEIEAKKARPQDVPVRHSVLVFDSKMYQAPSHEACLAAAEELGGREHTAGTAVDMSIIPAGNAWDYYDSVTYPMYLTFSRLLMWGLLDDRFATGEWGADKQAELLKAVQYDGDVVLPTAADHHRAMEAILHIRPAMILRHSRDPSAHLSWLYWGQFKSGMTQLVWDGLGPWGIALSENPLDASRMATVCLRHAVLAQSNPYSYYARPKLFMHQTEEQMLTDTAHTLRALRRLVLTRSFGARADEILPMAPTVTVLSRQGVRNKRIAPFNEFIDAVRAVALHHHHNFNVVEIGNNNLQGQMLPFFTSRVVIMVTGAAMSNTLFLRRDSSLILLWKWGPFSIDESKVSLNGAADDPWFTKFHYEQDETWRPNEVYNISHCLAEHAADKIVDVTCIRNVFPPIELVTQALNTFLPLPMEGSAKLGVGYIGEEDEG
ncbi:uncharacterized protein AMSG_09778 [Thecamonas trahens ATCC 50062]|uniref:Glycosyltransferase 61 catalytic domain-containing protein n=1 Tax=Thecamonas trahens ATCC 50062 TaxID=461836 RepID=A0A0L0DNE4_THETB|nr:hypothetical protein AMSG_09778 [Thecamonas trahens ATCC 50062]KNC53832.1 hypothetical protein AMSG_09778 [Thecamonas trahens ATCC 50062]|eukprot:XP_013754215.1 hypothetical protein AMSG_09778 [Thecamonas trahens ATCC 50062]